MSCNFYSLYFVFSYLGLVFSPLATSKGWALLWVRLKPVAMFVKLLFGASCVFVFFEFEFLPLGPYIF